MDSENKKDCNFSKSKFFDSHIHLNSLKISGWEGFEVEKEWVFNNVSTNLEDLNIALEQSKNRENVYVTAGIHPLEIENLELEKTIELLDLIIVKNREKIISVGEIGFDFYRVDKESVEDRQRMWFYSQIELAKKHKLPIMLHIRSAHKEALDLLSSFIGLRGVVHCFEGTKEIAEKYLNLGENWMISVSPIVYRDSNDFLDFIETIDIKRLLVETDSPFLSKNYEKIIDLIGTIAEKKGLKFQECKDILWRNFCRFFKILDFK